MLKFNWKYFLGFIVLTGVEVFIALFVRDAFIRPYGGDILVVLVLYCLLRSALPARWWMPPALFVFATAVEFSQLMGLVRILGLEGNRLAATLMGTSFSWWDIACYAAGALLVWLWQWKVDRPAPAQKQH